MENINFRDWKGKSKFRVWLEKLGIMQYSDILSSFFKDYETEHIPIMQFTDLKDKNDKEIYEGDIVQQFSDDDPYFQYVVIFKRGAFGYQPHGEDYDFISYSENKHFNWINRQSDKIEIIGNIYLNPELLPKDARQLPPIEIGGMS